jgi:serine protease inhibitor
MSIGYILAVRRGPLLRQRSGNRLSALDQAVHRANITVDEWGTEAAAVTGLGFAM